MEWAEWSGLLGWVWGKDVGVRITLPRWEEKGGEGAIYVFRRACNVEFFFFFCVWWGGDLSLFSAGCVLIGFGEGGAFAWIGWDWGSWVYIQLGIFDALGMGYVGARP